MLFEQRNICLVREFLNVSFFAATFCKTSPHVHNVGTNSGKTPMRDSVLHVVCGRGRRKRGPENRRARVRESRAQHARHWLCARIAYKYNSGAKKTKTRPALKLNVNELFSVQRARHHAFKYKAHSYTERTRQKQCHRFKKTLCKRPNEAKMLKRKLDSLKK